MVTWELLGEETGDGDGVGVETGDGLGEAGVLGKFIWLEITAETTNTKTATIIIMGPLYILWRIISPMSTGKGNEREGTYTTRVLEMEMGMGMVSALESELVLVWELVLESVLGWDLDLVTPECLHNPGLYRH